MDMSTSTSTPKSTPKFLTLCPTRATLAKMTESASHKVAKCPVCPANPIRESQAHSGDHSAEIKDNPAAGAAPIPTGFLKVGFDCDSQRAAK
jgi:hypothetical protein